MSLFIEQKAAINKLSKLRAGALFMEMGTGKTRTAIELAKAKQNDFDVVIWIAPAALIREQSYLNEIDKWNDDLSISFFTIEGISQSDKSFMDLRNLTKTNRIFCIVDESLTIKNAIAKRTKRLLDMWHCFDFRLILNGTPLSKGLIDLYSQINFIHPNILKMSETQFAHNFLTFKKEGFRAWHRWSLPANEAALIEIIRPYIFDAELNVNIKFTHTNEYFSLTNSENNNYSDFKKELLQNKFMLNFLAIAQKFQQEYTICQNKIKWIDKNIKSLNKTIIFVKFHKEIDFLKKRFVCLEYSGRQKDDLSLLNSTHNILLCTYGTGSKGLNLQMCQNIIFFSQTFDWGQKKHAIHRIVRKGQEKPVKIFDLFVNTGLENIIKQSLDKKTNVVNHIGALIDKKKALSL